ncbi:MAG: hypothetical protein IJK26_09150 [Clostridia bacterium]|nr:hypothetical protein [Clostridia bacterium]
MNGREYWDFLDEWKPNLLYQYAEGSSQKYNHTAYLTTSQNAYYLIWFVYRYVLECETLEAALQYANLKTLNDYSLLRVFRARAELENSLIVFGNPQFGLLEFGSAKSQKEAGEAKIVKCLCLVLEILYNRYNYLEQLECCVKHFGRANACASRQSAPVIKAKEIIKNSINYMQKDARYEEMLNQHKATRKEILGDCYYEL